MPEELGIPDPEDPYARLPDGRNADVGILRAASGMIETLTTDTPN
jgi:hypothetical protein